MAPVILRMNVHCRGCAGKIRRAVKNVPGVEEVWVSVDTGLVVIAGTSLDASRLRWRIQSWARTPVTVVSDGGAEEPPPPPQYAAPYGYGGGGTTIVHRGGGAPPAPHHQLPAAYYQQHPYGYGWAPAAPLPPPPQQLVQFSRQYVPNEAPACFNDDNPNAYCSVQ